MNHYLVNLVFIAVLVGGTVQSSENVDVDPSDEICSSLPTGTGLVAHPVYCALFYFCDSWKHDLMECPSGLYFNPEKGTCDYQDAVPNCDGGTHPPSTGPTTKPTSTSTFQTPEPEPTLTTTTESGTGTTSVGTTSVGTTSVGTTSVGTTPGGQFYCPPNVAIIFLPYPNDCTKFYQCESGVMIKILSCSNDWWFNVDRQACMTPWTSTCPN